jgi:hypothetical protein
VQKSLERVVGLDCGCVSGPCIAMGHPQLGICLVCTCVRVRVLIFCKILLFSSLRPAPVTQPASVHQLALPFIRLEYLHGALPKNLPLPRPSPPRLFKRRGKSRGAQTSWLVTCCTRKIRAEFTGWPRMHSHCTLRRQARPVVQA